MAFILPPARESGGKASQFFSGVAEGLGDDLPQLLNNFFAQRAINKEKTQLQADLEALGDDASVIDRKLRIKQAKIDEAEKKRLLEIEDYRGLQNLLKLKGKITPQAIVENFDNPQVANLMISLKNQEIAEEKQIAADKRQKSIDEAKIVEEKEKTEVQRGKDKNTFLKGLPADLKIALGTEAYESLTPDQRTEIMDSGSNFFDQTGGDPVEARRLTIEKALGKEPTEFDEGPGEPSEEKRSSFAKGADSSILNRTKALVSGEPLTEYNKRIALPKDASLLDKFLYGMGKYSVDFPFFFAGATAGGQVGGAIGTLVSAPTLIGVPFGVLAGSIIGSGAGAFAVPTMIEKGLTLYQGYLEKGGEGSFGDFIKAGAETLQAGVDSGIEGAMFGILSKLIPVLNQYSPFKKLFNMKGVSGKAAQEIVRSATQTGGIIGSRIVSGQKVSGDDAVELFTQAFAFNALGRMSPKLQKIIGEKIEKSGANPEDFTQNVKERLASKNQDPNNPALLTRAINDVSKEYSKARGVFEKTEKARVGKEQLEEVRTEKKKLAERISEEPIEEHLKEKKPTQKVQKAQKEVAKVEAKITKEHENIESLERNIEKAKPAQQKIRERGVELAKQEIGRLETSLTQQKSIVEKEKPIKPPEQTPAQLATAIIKHNAELVQISKDPTSELAKGWQEKFARDKKFQIQLEKEARTGELPSPEKSDRRIRMLEPYLKAYKELLNTVQKELGTLKGQRGPENTKLRNEIKALENNIKKNIKINESKQKLHNRKLYVKQLAKGKGRAYLKQLVKNLGTTAKEFQKDFIRTKEILDSSSAKTVKVSQKTLNKSIDQVSKNPTKQNIDKLSTESGLTKEEITQANQEGQDLAKEAKQSIEKGEPFDKFLKKIKDVIEKYKEENIPKLKRATISAIIFGGSQYALEKAIGYKAPFTVLTLLSPGDLPARLGVTGVVNLYRFVYRKAEEVYWKKQLRQARSIRAKTTIVNNLKEKGWSTARLKELRR